ncbi:MAG: hypothetical protein ABIW76_01035 [Fibrobacteria bacterium]
MGTTRLIFQLLLAVLFFGGCAVSKHAAPAEEAARPPMDRMLARLVLKGEFDKVFRNADSLAASKDPAEREIAEYWKCVAWLYRGEPDSALTLLEANQGKWTGGLRKVHAGLFLGLARQASLSREAAQVRHEDPPKPSYDKSLQDRLESLQKENADLRAETVRLATEKERYQKLLKDLETIR